MEVLISERKRETWSGLGGERGPKWSYLSTTRRLGIRGPGRSTDTKVCLGRRLSVPVGVDGTGGPRGGSNVCTEVGSDPVRRDGPCVSGSPPSTLSSQG